jgi:hypothetical protein
MAWLRGTVLAEIRRLVRAPVRRARGHVVSARGDAGRLSVRRMRAASES